MKFPFITQLKYCQTLDFEAGSINKLKPLIKRNYVCRFQKQWHVFLYLFITQLKYCQKLDFDASPNIKLKILVYLGLPTPKNVSRFEQSGVSSNLWSYRAFLQKVRRGMSWLSFPSAWPPSLSHQYFAFKIWCRTSKLVSVKLRTPKIIQIYQILGFAGVCGFFASVLRAFCG